VTEEEERRRQRLVFSVDAASLDKKSPRFPLAGSSSISVNTSSQTLLNSRCFYGSGWSELETNVQF